MTIPQWLLISIVTLTMTGVIANRIRLDIAALLTAILLGILQYAGVGMLGTAGSKQAASLAISGFGQPVVITLLSLFIIAKGLDKSGLMRWIASRLIKVGGNDEGHLIGLLAAITAVFSLFINNVAAGILVLPTAMEISRRTGIKPSKLLIPVSYGSLLGGMATYFTTANIVMSDLLAIANPPQQPLKLLDFALTGGLIAFVGILFLSIFGKRLLPDREPASDQALQHLTGSELESFYHIQERLWEARIMPGSPVIGKTMEEIGFGFHWGISIVAFRKEKENIYIPSYSQHVLGLYDTLIIIGRAEKVLQLQKLNLEIRKAQENGSLSQQGIIFAEVILSPHSMAQRQTLKEIEFRQRYGLSVIALRRHDAIHRTDVGDFKLAFGDSLLVIGPNQRFMELKKSPDFIIFEPNPADQPLDKKLALQSSFILMAAVIASIIGVPIYLSMLFAALLTIIFKVITPEEAYQSIEWQAIFIVAGMYAVSLAMVNTGLASMFGTAITRMVAPLGPLGIAGSAFLVSAALTQIIGGQVTAMVAGPVVITAAMLTNVNPQAVAVAAAIGCSSSFFTPISHPVNTLMVGPANYRFSDYARVGWPLFVLSFVFLLAGLSLFWGL